jgi:outer membrane protein OmpA-like peptidoglycan-associated protein
MIKRGGLLLLIVGSVFGTPVALGQSAPTVPTTEEIVRALNPETAAETRSLKGIQVIPGQNPQEPSIDLTVNFSFDSAKLETDTLLTLKRLGAALQDPRLSRFTFLIAGHTDGKGTDEYNQKLSEARAGAVRDHLIFFYDVAPERLAAVGFGKRRLLIPDDPDSSVNRRVQIINQGPKT